MKWFMWIAVSIGILLIVCLGSFVTYNIAYSVGEVEGYDKGYSAGQNVGYDSGMTEGYSLGQQDGYSEGYDSGKTEGYEEGYDTGYDEGVEAGLGHGYTLRDPTYKEALRFLRRDKTDENEYDEDTYICTHYARDVCNNAEDEGLRCALIDLRYSEGGHSIIAFDTVDKGLSCFEPQSDERAEPVIGERFYECVIPAPGFYYEKPAFDDTIMDILVIW